MVILNIPIEPLEERYSTQWDKWFKAAFETSGLDVVHVYGQETSGKINSGSFLDVIETNQYKTSQLQMILKFLSGYDKEEKIVLFFHDLWFPGLETIAYIREGLGLKYLKICGCLHAGSYDEFDFLNKKGMTPWAEHMEMGWLNGIVDKIFVATEFHKRLLIKTRMWKNPNKIEVTGFPFYTDFINPEFTREYTNREKIIVFPHRLDAEKNPQMFNKLKADLEDEFSDWNFCMTKKFCDTKDRYYQILQKAYISVSFADQETWGIAMQESVICGCLPLVPNRLSYSEMYLPIFKYDCECDLVDRIRMLILHYPDLSMNQQHYTIMKKGKDAIPNMIKIIREL